MFGHNHQCQALKKKGDVFNIVEVFDFLRNIYPQIILGYAGVIQEPGLCVVSCTVFLMVASQ